MSNDSTSNPSDRVSQAKDRLKQGERLWLPEAADPDWSRYGKEPVDPERVCTASEIGGFVVEKSMVTTEYEDPATRMRKLAPAVVIHLDPEYRSEEGSDYIARTGYGKVDGDLFSAAAVGDWVGLTYQGIRQPRDLSKKPYSSFRTAHVPLAKESAPDVRTLQSGDEDDTAVEEGDGDLPMAPSA